MAPWPTQLVMDCAVRLNSREGSGACAWHSSSTICCLKSAGYGGLTLDIFGSSNTKHDVFTEPDQLPEVSRVQVSRPIWLGYTTPTSNSCTWSRSVALASPVMISSFLIP